MRLKDVALGGFDGLFGGSRGFLLPASSQAALNSDLSDKEALGRALQALSDVPAVQRGAVAHPALSGIPVDQRPGAAQAAVERLAAATAQHARPRLEQAASSVETFLGLTPDERLDDTDWAYLLTTLASLYEWGFKTDETRWTLERADAELPGIADVALAQTLSGRAQLWKDPASVMTRAVSARTLRVAEQQVPVADWTEDTWNRIWTMTLTRTTPALLEGRCSHRAFRGTLSEVLQDEV